MYSTSPITTGEFTPKKPINPRKDSEISTGSSDNSPNNYYANLTLNNRPNYRKFESLLLQEGYKLTRTKGSHNIYQKNNMPNIVFATYIPHKLFKFYI